MHWKTLEKILSESALPGYRRKVERLRPKLGPYLERIEQIMAQDKEAPRKQRHTAKRILERIRAEGYQGGYTQVKEAVRRLKAYGREVFVPLIHRPGEAQVDFGYALVKESGKLRKVVFFVMTLPYSDAMFIQVFDRITTEVFWEAHVRAFRFFGGVPRRITYDNEKLFVAQIMGAHTRRLTRGFLPASEPLPVQGALLPGAACEREGRGGRDGQVCAAELSGAGAAGRGSGGAERVSARQVCRGPQAPAQGQAANEGRAS
jgi:transposase